MKKVLEVTDSGLTMLSTNPEKIKLVKYTDITSHILEVSFNELFDIVVAYRKSLSEVSDGRTSS